MKTTHRFYLCSAIVSLAMGAASSAFANTATNDYLDGSNPAMPIAKRSIGGQNDVLRIAKASVESRVETKDQDEIEERYLLNRRLPKSFSAQPVVIASP